MPEDKRFSRRAIILGLLGVGGAAGGTLLRGTELNLDDLPGFDRGKGNSTPGQPENDTGQHDYPVVVYDPNETYTGDPNGTTFTPTPGYEPIESWEEAIPSDCSLSSDEKHWLVSRADMHLDIEDDGSFFSYVGREIRFDQDEDDIVMNVDHDYTGGRYEPEEVYRVPGACEPTRTDTVEEETMGSPDVSNVELDEIPDRYPVGEELENITVSATGTELDEIRLLKGKRFQPWRTYEESDCSGSVCELETSYTADRSEKIEFTAEAEAGREVQRSDNIEVVEFFEE